MTPYPGLRFHPNDLITIRAGGCVDVGGDTPARRYVNPDGPDSERLYHGRVWIPGVTPGLVRIGGWKDRALLVPQDLPDSPELFIRLGYEAEDYRSVHPHEGGQASAQCNGEGPAFVEVEISSGPPAAANLQAFDLVWRKGVDPNLLPIHPLWNYWAAAAHTDPPDAQDASTCAAFPETNGIVTLKPTCTMQEPWIDRPKGFHSVICGIGGIAGTLHGHVNWGVATYKGAVSFGEWSFDSDYNLTLVPDAAEDLSNSILTVGNAGTGNAIELEFASGETVAGFQTPWWSDFREQVETAAPTLDSVYSIVTGLVGLDNEHGSHAELHPVYALAMRVDPMPQNETWAMFARNWGNEGFCSQDTHYLDLPGNRYTFRLPWAGGDSLPKIDMKFRSKAGKKVKPVITGSPSTGVLVTFNLGIPETKSMIEGELRLHWPAGIAPPPPPPAAPRPVTASVRAEPVAEGNIGGEEALNLAFESLQKADKANIQRNAVRRTRQLEAQKLPAADIRRLTDQDRVKAVCDLMKQQGKTTKALDEVCKAALP